MLTFAGCALDEPRRLLLRDGVPVHLEPQAFDVLVHLARNADRVVPREELLDVVWGDRFVSDSALGTRIKEIRRATGDDGDAQTVIRTVRGHGYQFVAERRAERSRTNLVGRDRDLREVLARSTPGSLVTVVGPGGVGKSSLVRACADESLGEVVVVDLTVLDDVRSLTAAVSRAARLSDGDDPVAFLGGRDLLLVLDDADDFVPEVAALAAAMLHRDGARVRLLSTCRQILGIEGEQVWPLLPLDEESSRQLLVRRARELAPLAGLDTRPPDELDRLTAAVDRLPLALEMLASTAGAVGLESLDAVLDVGEVGLSRRDAPERHRSLESLVSGSLDRLDDVDRAALVRLTAFAGPFTGQDAVAVLGAGAVDRLRSLSERSLVAPVVVGGVARQRLLRTVRDAVRRRTPDDELHEAASVHARHVAALLAEADTALRGPGEPAAVRVFERVADESRAAHAWARHHDRELAVELTRSLAQYSYTRMWPEPVEWARALATDGDEPDVALVLATSAGTSNRLDEARRVAEGLLSQRGRLRLEALETLADVEIYAADFSASAAYARQLIAESSTDGLEHHRAIGVTDLILSGTYGGDLDLASRAIDEAATLPEERLSVSDRAWLHYARGETLQLSGRPGGLDELRTAAEMAESVDNVLLTSIALTSVASVLAREEVAPSLPGFLRVLDEFLRRGNITHLTTTLRDVMPVLARLDEAEAAVVVAGWLLGPAARPGYPADVERVRQVVEEVRGRHGDDVEPWLARGRAGDAPAAAHTAAAAIRRHL